jgi:hypothetical protein
MTAAFRELPAADAAAGCGTSRVAETLSVILLLACVPAAMLLSGRILPQTWRPVYPGYLKFFVCQTLAAFVALGLVAMALGGRLSLPRAAGGGRFRYAFPVLLGAYSLWMSLSATWSAWPYGANAYVIREFAFMFLAFACFALLGARRRWTWFVRVFFVAAIAGVVLQGQYIVRTFVACGGRRTMTDIFFRRPFIYGNKNFACAPAICLALIAVGMLLGRLKGARSGGSKRGVWAIAAGLVAVISACAFMLLVADSMAGYLACVVAVSAYAILMLPLRRRGLVAASVVVAAVTALLVVLYTPGLRDRTIGAMRSGDPTVRARLMWWVTAGDMFTARPIAGWGVGSYASAYYRLAPQEADDSEYTRFVLATHPHNEFMRIGAETGLAGIVLYLLLLCSALIPSCRRLAGEAFEFRAVGYALWAGALAYLVQAALGNEAMCWDFALVYWMLLGALASLSDASDWSCCHTRAAGGAPRLRCCSWAIVLVAAAGIVLLWREWALRPYVSMVRLEAVNLRLNTLHGKLTATAPDELTPAARAAAVRYARQTGKMLCDAQEHCLWPYRVLSDRFITGETLVNLGDWDAGRAHLEWVQRQAPGAVRTEYLLARCYMRSGDKAKALVLMTAFLERHPGYTPAYVELAKLDAQLAAGMLLDQVAVRDGFGDPVRLALTGRLMAHLGRWDIVDALLGDAVKRGRMAGARALAADVRRFCERTGQLDRLNALRTKYAGLF